MISSVCAASPASIQAAVAAQLRYVCDAMPGIRRVRKGRGFVYYDSDGRAVRDAGTLARIRAIVIPPAWRDVWICPHADGHIQATARDARGRKQYRYHARWRRVRDENKYDRLIDFAAALPVIRRRVAADLGLPGLPREKVLAAVVRLLESTRMRIGNEQYARDNHSYGLTTLRDRHVRVNGERLDFRFRGKSGKYHAIALNDRRLAAVVRRCRDLPGYEVFQYLDAADQPCRVDSTEVNEYLRDITGCEYTAKDFRTWAGTVEAATALVAQGDARNATQAKKKLAEAIRNVAEQLGNTPSVCRKCYIHPTVLDAYIDGSLAPLLRRRTQVRRRSSAHGLQAHERAVIAVLKTARPKRKSARHA